MARTRPASHPALATIFFLHGVAMSMWFVPLSTLLDAAGYHSIKPFAFATSGAAAFVSPLLFGAMSDRHLGPVRVLRWLGILVAAALTLVDTAVDRRWTPLAVLSCIQLLALVALPTWSVVATVVLAELETPAKQFGPIRAFGTLGWMVGCWIVSVLQADSSTLAGRAAVLGWLIVAAFTLFLPNVAPPSTTAKVTLSQRFGLDALALLKVPEHRTVFLTAALVTMPLAAFYPFTPPHLRSFGLERTSAWMTLGQVTEIAAMFSLAYLLKRWPLKWVFGAGLICAFLRYVLCALDSKLWLLLGISLHGFAFTLFFVTAPIYLDGKVEPAWRARAQALMVLMTSGFGNLFGYLGCGWWLAFCEGSGVMNWHLFWGGLAAVVGLVLAYFFRTYGRGARSKPAVS